MRKQLFTGLLALFIFTGCSVVNQKEQVSACKFAAAEGMDIDFKVKAQADTINKLEIDVELTYEKLGYDLSKVSNSIKKSTAKSILDQLGFGDNNKGVTVTTEFTDKALLAHIEIKLDKADTAVLESLGFDGVSQEELSFKKFLVDAQDQGVKCEEIEQKETENEAK